MGVRTNLLAVTPTAAEIAACELLGQDLVGMLALAATSAADLIEVITLTSKYMGSTANQTTILNQLTALT